MWKFSFIFIVLVCASIVAAAPQSIEHDWLHPKTEFNDSDEINPKDVPKIFRCGFKVVDNQLKGKKELLEIWNEYKPFLELLTSKIEDCIKKRGESQAEKCYVQRGLLFGAIIDELSERIKEVSPETQQSLDRLVKQKCVP